MITGQYSRVLFFYSTESFRTASPYPTPALHLLLPSYLSPDFSPQLFLSGFSRARSLRISSFYVRLCPSSLTCSLYKSLLRDKSVKWNGRLLHHSQTYISGSPHKCLCFGPCLHLFSFAWNFVRKGRYGVGFLRMLLNHVFFFSLGTRQRFASPIVQCIIPPSS